MLATDIKKSVHKKSVRWKWSNGNISQLTAPFRVQQERPRENLNPTKKTELKWEFEWEDLGGGGGREHR